MILHLFLVLLLYVHFLLELLFSKLLLNLSAVSLSILPLIKALFKEDLLLFLELEAKIMILLTDIQQIPILWTNNQVAINMEKWVIDHLRNIQLIYTILFVFNIYSIFMCSLKVEILKNLKIKRNFIKLKYYEMGH